MQRDDSGLDDRAKTFVFERTGRVDVLRCQQFPELLPTTVFTEHSDYGHVIDKFAQVPGDVGRPSRVKRFSRHFHHGDGSLRRNAADFAPHKFIEHQVADNRNSPRSCALEDLLQPVQPHGAIKLPSWRVKSAGASRPEWINEVNSGISCARREFRLRFASLNPEYETKINSRK